MNLQSLLASLRVPRLWAQLQIRQDAATFFRLHFLYAALDLGLLVALRTPRSKADLIRLLQVQQPDLLDPLLEMGVLLGELGYAGERYRLRGARARALSRPAGDPLAALIEEYLTYHNSVYRRLAARLRGAPPGDYLAGTGTLIARSSRITEPFIAHFIRSVVPARGPLRILEVGCGSGVYLRHAARLNPACTGVGLDMQADVVEHARGNLARWGLGDRFTIIEADIRRPPATIDGPFDLVTLYNNIYYFPPEERPALFRALGARLAPQGTFALVSSLQGPSLATVDFDLALRSTRGCTPLPTLAELIDQLHQGGFRQVTHTQLIPLEPFYGVVARR